MAVSVTRENNKRMSKQRSTKPKSNSTLPPAEIFKAYDIRGIVGKTLSGDIAEQIGRAIGSEAISRNVKAIVLGRDGRLSGPELVSRLSDGLLKSGCDVIDIGMVPTPVCYFASHHLETGSCISVTGSHNPPDYNGFKIVLAGETLSEDSIQELRRRIVDNDLTTGAGKRTEQDLRSAYINRIVSDVKSTRPLNLVVDCGNGVAGELAPELFRKMGCKVSELFCEIDGHFPNHHPDPSRPENLADLIAEVKKQGADLGLAFDGDGDRLGVVTPNGDIIWPDRQMNLFARDVLSRNPGAEIIYDVKCSRTLDKAIREAGGKARMWKTGHSLIKTKMKQTGALLAGEMSGHIFFKERWYGFDDAMYTGARLLEILSKDDRPVQAVFDALPDTVNTPELQIKLNEGENHGLVKALVQAADFPGAEINTIDGIRADFTNGWGLVRASNTTPTLVLRFEADSEQALEEVQKQFRELFERVRPDLKLPF